MIAAAFDDAIDHHVNHAVDFLAALVREPSVLGNEGGAQVAFATEMTDLGFEVTTLPFASELAADPRAGVLQQVDTPRYNTLASRGGRLRSSLMLHGHIDVVPAASPDLWESDPFTPRLTDGRLYGRGAGDMKCGFAMGALALRALREVEPTFDDWDLSFLAAIEEECTGNGTLSAALQGTLADSVIALEPTDLGILLGGVGIIWVDVKVIGRTAHAESAHLAVNPFDLLWSLIVDLRAWTHDLVQTDDDPALTGVASPYNLNVGMIHGGDWPSSVPTQATARLRIAFPRSWSPERAEREIVARANAFATTEGHFPEPPQISTSGFRAPGYHLAADHDLVTRMRVAHHSAHQEDPPLFSLGSTTDARTYLHYFDTPALCYGPSATNIHGVDESVDIDSIIAGARTLGRFIAEWFKGEAT